MTHRTAYCRSGKEASSLVFVLQTSVTEHISDAAPTRNLQVDITTVLRQIQRAIDAKSKSKTSKGSAVIVIDDTPETAGGTDEEAGTHPPSDNRKIIHRRR